MVNKNNVILIIVVIIGIVIYDSYFKPIEEAKSKLQLANEREQMINLWSKSSIEFTENFNCKELKHQEGDILIKKFIVIDSYEDCNVDLDTNLEFEKISKFKKFYTRKIDEANVVIWIQQRKGKTEGKYSNSTNAIRFCANVNFIDKKTKIIYKKETVDFLGNPPDEIRRTKGTYGGDELFGIMPREEIYNFILKEINKA